MHNPLPTPHWYPQEELYREVIPNPKIEQVLPNKA